MLVGEGMGRWRHLNTCGRLPPRRRAGPKGCRGVVENLRIVPQSGLVIMRGELAAVVAENLRLRGDMGGKDGEPGAMARRLASLEAKVEGGGGRARSAARGSGCSRQGTPRREIEPGATRGSGCSSRQGRPGRRQQEARRKRQVPQQLSLPTAKRRVDCRVPLEKGDLGALCAAGRAAAAGREQGALRRDAQAGHKPP